MPYLTKGPFPYVASSPGRDVLVVSANCPEQFRWYDTDWEGKKGMSIKEVLKGLCREDLLPHYTSGPVDIKQVKYTIKEAVVEYSKQDGKLF